MSLLENINSPNDLKKLEIKQLSQLAAEIREFMIDDVSKSGGHLAPSLGVVELTLALHYCYNAPVDKILWDVGHQTYTHKIITGRRDKFNTLRQYEGISGFPRVKESEYDTTSTGHASTSISSALGIAKARDIKNESYHVIAVIGDGSLSGGLAFEGLNNLGIHSTDMTVILNDNEMSIAKNVGALSRYLTRIITDKHFNKIKSDVWELLGNMSNVGKKIRSMVHNIDDMLKRLVTPGKFFEDMGIRYVGPIDGHNINELIGVFKFAQQSPPGPLLIHALTKKGKGYSFAENNATKYHGIGKFSINTGNVTTSSSTIPSYSEIFGKALIEIAKKQDNIVAITAAMPDSTGLGYFKKKFPKRFFDVGIAEGHAVTFAAGLAHQGLKPVVAIYSTFLQRAYDQLIHDVALDNLNIVFCIDRAGLVGDDGPTHHGTMDISFLRAIPGVVIMAPSNEVELRNMLFTAIKYIDGPTFIRYPRGTGRGLKFKDSMQKIPLFKPSIISEGKECAILSLGDYIKYVEKACKILKTDSIKPTLIDARYAKPLDKEFYLKIFKKYSYIITVESNSIKGGFGSAILELAAEFKINTKILTIGYPDTFVTHGNTNKLLELLKLTPESIAKKIKKFITN